MHYNYYEYPDLFRSHVIELFTDAFYIYYESIGSHNRKGKIVKDNVSVIIFP